MQQALQGSPTVWLLDEGLPVSLFKPLGKAIILILLPQVSREKYVQNFEDSWKKNKILAISGQVSEWPGRS
jgi:hypothetical protein